MRRPLTIALLLGLVANCGGSSSTTSGDGGGDEPLVEAFFYQFIGPGRNSVRAGTTSGGIHVTGAGRETMAWTQTGASPDAYGDPVWSRLGNGRWAMMAGTGTNDSRGRGRMLYQEGDCPILDEAALHVLGPRDATGCKSAPSLVGGKTSQIFAVGGDHYVFFMNGGELHLAHLAGPSTAATTLADICLRQTPPASLADLAVGDATVVVSKTAAGGLLLSDSGIARRRDGTWVLFVKGIAQSSGCAPASVCELCARKVHRATSKDLLTWSALEAVAEKASIPEATTGADGVVRLYYQDFTQVCATNDVELGGRAPISMVVEDSAGVLSAPRHVVFDDEAFESDSKIHYATNANPVLLPDAAAVTAYTACLEKP